ncbi:hypothetical protein EJB05_52227, partial [Eragrostis curvula]
VAHLSLTLRVEVDSGMASFLLVGQPTGRLRSDLLSSSHLHGFGCEFSCICVPTRSCEKRRRFSLETLTPRRGLVGRRPAVLPTRSSLDRSVLTARYLCLERWMDVAGSLRPEGTMTLCRLQQLGLVHEHPSPPHEVSTPRLQIRGVVLFLAVDGRGREAAAAQGLGPSDRSAWRRLGSLERISSRCIKRMS